MTRRRYRLWTILLLVVALAAAGTGFVWQRLDPDGFKSYIDNYKEARNTVVLMVGALLALLYQRRNHFAKLMADSWPRTVEAVQAAIQYTYRFPLGGTPPCLGKALEADYEAFSRVMEGLSRAIDLNRALFINPGSLGPRQRGFYAIENLKRIRSCVAALGYGPSYNSLHAAVARKRIVSLWQHVYHTVPREFDRVQLQY